MKRIFLILSLIIIYSQFVFGQNYQTFNSGRTMFFEDDSKFVAAVRIDSVAFDTDSILYPFKILLPVDYSCYSPNVASWIGPKVIIKGNSENLFFNRHGDTVTIKTNALLNESWTFYQTENLVIIAEITEWSTKEFLGIEDSVKTIDFKVYDNSMNEIDHEINQFSLQLSKDYGLLSAFYFDLFPDTNYGSDHYVSYLYPDFFLNLIGFTNPETGFQNLTMFNVYDFQPGDELHSHSINYNDWSSYSEYKTILKYLERTDFSDSIAYKKEKISSFFDTSTGNTIYSHDTVVSIIKPDTVFDKLPTELIITQSDLYIWRIYNYNNPKKYNAIDNFFWYDNIGQDCWEEPIFHGGSWSDCYIKGLGGNYYNYHPENPLCPSSYKKLVYYKKGEETWGEPLIISNITNETINNRFSVFPNPAKTHITISSEITQTLTVEIFDLTGKLVSSGKIQTNEEFNISSFSNGIYLLKITDEKRNSFTNKLIKQ